MKNTDEIQVGEYLRTKGGDISKIENIDKDSIFLDEAVWSKQDLYEKTSILYLDDEEIKKASPNIIDLIELGDYVNGILINYIDDDERPRTIYHDAYDFEDIEKFHNKDIKSIVTKEQFEEMEYKI